MRNTAEFDRCIDFLVRMIEKYGDAVLQQITADTLYGCEVNATENSQKSILKKMLFPVDFNAKE